MNALPALDPAALREAYDWQFWIRCSLQAHPSRVGQIQIRHSEEPALRLSQEIVLIDAALESDMGVSEAFIDPALIDQNVKPCTYRLELALFGPPDSRQ